MINKISKKKLLSFARANCLRWSPLSNGMGQFCSTFFYLSFPRNFFFVELELSVSSSFTTILIRSAASNLLCNLRRLLVKKITQPNPIKLPTKTRSCRRKTQFGVGERNQKWFFHIIRKGVWCQELTIGGTNLILIKTSSDR